MRLVNAKEMLRKAKEGHYAVGHFNLNNMESVRAFLLAAQETHSPIILGVSGGTAKYMGGYRTITDMVEDFMAYLDITVPVALHVDHGKYEEALDALNGGFSSVMFDGSKLPIEENLEKTRHIVELCREKNGNIHGKYPADWKGLNFEVLAAIQKAAGDIPLVLHGGSGIPDDMVRQAISLGVCKVNVNTECQIAFTEATRKFIEDGRDLTGNGFTPRALLADGLVATKEKCIEKMTLFGSLGKA